MDIQNPPMLNKENVQDGVRTRLFRRRFSSRLLVQWSAMFLLAGLTVGEAAQPDTMTDALNNLNQWVVEQCPGGTVVAKEGRLLIVDSKGCTVWFKKKLKAPVSISYDAVVRSSGRVSDLNCFWMASDPAHPEDLFGKSNARTGKFEEYDALQTYYVGYGGNSNTTTRFRRYHGGGIKPLLPEHDKQSKEVLLQPDHVYHIELTAADGRVKFARDGEVIFSWQDPEPLKEGWFGFRTVDSQIEVRNFHIASLEHPANEGSAIDK